MTKELNSEELNSEELFAAIEHVNRKQLQLLKRCYWLLKAMQENAPVNRQELSDVLQQMEGKKCSH